MIHRLITLAVLPMVWLVNLSDDLDDVWDVNDPLLRDE